MPRGMELRISLSEKESANLRDDDVKKTFLSLDPKDRKFINLTNIINTKTPSDPTTN